MEVRASLHASFLGLEAADFEDSNTGRTHRITWKYDTARTELPLEFAQCTMVGFGLRAIGHGDGLTRVSAFRRAFAEAWERLWFHRLMAGQLPQYTLPLSTTNGFACGSSSEDAVRRSRGEAIERAMLLDAWETMRGWHRLRSSRRIRTLLALLPGTYAGWSWNFFLIRARDIPETQVLIAKHSEWGAVVDSLCEAASFRSEAKLVLSVLRTLADDDRKSTEVYSPSEELPEFAEPQDHGRYYRNPANSAAFEFLDGGGAGGELELASLDKLESVVLAPAQHFPAVAVSHHPDWPILRWGRSSIRRANPWPHPLA